MENRNQQLDYSKKQDNTTWKSYLLSTPQIDPNFIIGYISDNKTYIYSQPQNIELTDEQQLNTLDQFAKIISVSEIIDLCNIWEEMDQIFVIEVKKKFWNNLYRKPYINNIELLNTWHPGLTKIGNIPLISTNIKKVALFDKKGLDSFVVGYFDINQSKTFYYNYNQQIVEQLSDCQARPIRDLLDFPEVIKKFANRAYFLLEIPKNYNTISENEIRELYPSFDKYLKKLNQETIKHHKSFPIDILRYARHIDLSEQLEIVSPSNYKNIKDFKPFLTNYKGEVLAIPCSTRIKNQDVNFNIFGWYIDDNGFVKLRWFPHHKDAVKKRSSTIFIDIRSKQLFFSGSILDSDTQDPVFLESIQFLDERLKQHGQVFQNNFSSFMTYIHQMKKMGRLKSKDYFPTSPHRRRRY